MDDGQIMDEVTQGEEPAVEAGSALRNLIVKAYPEVVPELLAGETVEEMLASLPAAQEAYQRVVEQARPQVAPVPNGGGASRSVPVDIGSMSPGLKIREGLRRR